MKRVRPAASIEEWVAIKCAMAVKAGTETRRVKWLEAEAARLRDAMVYLREEIKDLQSELTRYENDFLENNMDLARCYNCERYWSIQEDLADCDGRCELRCRRCVTAIDCAQCGEPGCSDCLIHCQAIGCSAKICPPCMDTNTECVHRMCDNHNAPCEKCAPAASSSSESLSE